MPKSTLQGSQDVFSECHGIQLLTQPQGRNRFGRGTVPSRGEGRRSTDAEPIYAIITPYRTCYRPSNQDKVVADRRRPLPIPEGQHSSPRHLLSHRPCLAGWPHKTLRGGALMSPKALRRIRDEAIVQ